MLVAFTLVEVGFLFGHGAGGDDADNFAGGRINGEDALPRTGATEIEEAILGIEAIGIGEESQAEGVFKAFGYLIRRKFAELIKGPLEFHRVTT